jgi:hypothetical protein
MRRFHQAHDLTTPPPPSVSIRVHPWLKSFLFVLCLAASLPLTAAPADYFKIKVVDAQTGRGVPLVELETVNHLRFYTDSAGLIAFFEPALMDRDVFFYVRSHGYEFPKDGFGYTGKTLKVKAGASAELKIKRLNLAERLYRTTGEGIYRDSVLLGEPVPLQEPLLNGQVLGQDTVMAVPYRGKLYWFWGDTQRAKYPLGHFGTAGAVSDLPATGGLDPAQGVNFKYFTGEDGFSRPLMKLDGPGPIWVHGALTLPDPTGRERLVTHYMRMKNLGEKLEHGLAIFNDEQERFDKLVQFDLANDWRRPNQHPVRHRDTDGVEYFYFPAPYATVRVKADWQSVTNAASYEAFTCLRGPVGAIAAFVDSDAAGAAVYRWRADANPLDYKQERVLIQQGKLRAQDAHYQTRDVDSGKTIDLHVGTVFWNAYRKRWIMIAQQTGGSPSFLGEIWFAESDSLTGPWPLARKIVSHTKYTFYNPAHHPFFDHDGGRVIYFEGTYTEQFTSNTVATPRYDYNQIMYRLDLADPKLGLPLSGK